MNKKLYWIFDKRYQCSYFEHNFVLNLTDLEKNAIYVQFLNIKKIYGN